MDESDKNGKDSRAETKPNDEENNDDIEEENEHDNLKLRKTVSHWIKAMIVVTPIKQSLVQKRVLMMSKMIAKGIMKKKMKMKVSGKVPKTTKKKMILSMKVSPITVTKVLK